MTIDSKIYVITGRSSSGKTTLINELEKRGHCVLLETARPVLEERKNYEATKEEWLYRQKEMFTRQLRQENKALNGADRLIFSDRSLPEVLAYCLHLIGYIPEELKEFNLERRYSKILAVDKLPFKPDGTRIEKDEGEVEEIYSKIMESYQNFGYNPISVPVFPGNKEESVKARADFILNQII